MISSMAGNSEKAVYTALVANSLVTLCKLGAFLATGSAAMLSEAIHSFADVSNQSLLALGIKKSEAEPTPEFPYGFSRERFIWALISAVGLFFLGCGVTVYHGVSTLMHPPVDEGHMSPVILGGVLLFAFLIEGWALHVALRAVNEQRGDTPLLQHLRESTDPMTSAVLLEDGVAVAGVVVAALCIGLSIQLDSHIPDALGSIVIGLMMGVMAVVLVRRNRELLLGEAPRAEMVAAISDLIAAQPEVEGVHDVKAVVLGGGQIHFKAEIDFDAREIARQEVSKLDLTDAVNRASDTDALSDLLTEFGAAVVESLGDTVDRIEAEASRAVPELAHMDLEAD